MVFIGSPKVLLFECARGRARACLDSKPLKSSRYLKETEGGMRGRRPHACHGLVGSSLGRKKALLSLRL